MKILIAEDDLVSRRLLQVLLSPYGQVDIAVDGEEATKTMKMAWEGEKPYDLVCLDVLMPKINGQQVLSFIRDSERKLGIHGLQGVKVIMTTRLDGKGNIMSAFRSQCDGYIVKPVGKEKLRKELVVLGLLQDGR